MTASENPSWESIGVMNAGTTSDGPLVNLYMLQDEGIEVAIMNYGARIVSIRTADLSGNMANVVLGYSGLDSYIADQSSYLGAVVGRYANRIASGRFSIGDHAYQAVTNDKGNTLHGGIVGFDRRVWSAQTFTSGVELTLTSEDGDQGFPGNLTVRVRYSVSPKTLRIDYHFSTDLATIVNLTNHAYFNLSGDSHASILVDELTIAADWFTPIDSRMIPTGAISSVEGTPFDFRSKTAIGARMDSNPEQLRLAGGYDHNFVLNDSAGELRVVARLHNPATGRVLTVSTTEPGLQFYTGNFLHGERYGKAQEGHEKHTGLCLETQHFPDSPNHPNFPSTELLPGRPGCSTTILEFSVDSPMTEENL